MTEFLEKCAAAPIRLYRVVISPLISPRCRFTPTCSAYALQALRSHGILKGGLLSARRIVRCNPWHECSHHDPVPESFEWSIDRFIPIGYKRGKHSRGGPGNNKKARI